MASSSSPRANFARPSRSRARASCSFASKSAFRKRYVAERALRGRRRLLVPAEAQRPRCDLEGHRDRARRLLAPLLRAPDVRLRRHAGAHGDAPRVPAELLEEEGPGRVVAAAAAVGRVGALRRGQQDVVEVAAERVVDGPADERRAERRPRRAPGEPRVRGRPGEGFDGARDPAPGLGRAPRVVEDGAERAERAPHGRLVDPRRELPRPPEARPLLVEEDVLDGLAHVPAACRGGVRLEALEDGVEARRAAEVDQAADGLVREFAVRQRLAEAVQRRELASLADPQGPRVAAPKDFEQPVDHAVDRVGTELVVVVVVELPVVRAAAGAQQKFQLLAAAFGDGKFRLLVHPTDGVGLAKPLLLLVHGLVLDGVAEADEHVDDRL